MTEPYLLKYACCVAYLLRTNLKDQDPAQLWKFYIQFTQVEEAVKNLKGDLAIRPDFHQLGERIESPIS